MKKTAKSAPSPAPATASATPSASAAKPRRAPQVSPPPALIAKGENGSPPLRATIITAKIDVGFGNTLFLRGEGPGLSWNKGVPLDCVAEDRWVISIGEAARPFSFKFLLNDQAWSAGDNYSIEPGGSFVGTPRF